MKTSPLPPHSVEAEEALLGALLLNPEAYVEVADAVDGDDFYIVGNRWIFEALAETARESNTNDTVAVADRLHNRGRLEPLGGMPRLVHLISNTVSAFNAAHYAEIVREKADLRRLIRAASNIVAAAYRGDAKADQVRGLAEGEITELARTNGNVVSAEELAADAWERVSEYAKNPGIRGIPTGLAIDGVIGGLRKGVYIVGARPSMGKTAVMLQMVEGICQQGIGCVLFTIEMDKDELALRMATSLARVELQALEAGQVGSKEHRKILDALTTIHGWPLTVVDQSELRPTDVQSIVRREQMKRDVGAVFVDGLWLMVPTKDHGSRRENVGSISREMKRIQRKLDVSLVMTHQLNRACEYRQNKRPILADLRETGDVEQDTDVAIFLYRDGYYDPASPERYVIEFWIRKNRLGGPAGDVVNMLWLGSYMRCEKIELHRSPDPAL